MPTDGQDLDTTSNEVTLLTAHSFHMSCLPLLIGCGDGAWQENISQETDFWFLIFFFLPDRGIDRLLLIPNPLIIKVVKMLCNRRATGPTACQTIRTPSVHLLLTGGSRRSPRLPGEPVTVGHRWSSTSFSLLLVSFSFVFFFKEK